MKKLSILTLIFILLSSTNSLHAQLKDFIWDYEFCVCAGKYDTKKYTEEQLENTRDYLWYGKSIQEKHLAWRPEEMSEIDTKKIDEAFNEIYSKLTSLKFVETSYWEEIKVKRIAALKADYMAKKLTAMSYKNPQLLKSFQVYSHSCDNYIEALTEGGSKLLKEWEKLIEMKKAQNASPERIQKEYEDKLSSPKKLEHARIDLMLFGFWNCANHTTPKIENQWEIGEEFKKLFTDVKCDCDMP